MHVCRSSSLSRNLNVGFGAAPTLRVQIACRKCPSVASWVLLATFLKQLDRSVWLKAQTNRTLNNNFTASPHAPHVYLSKRRLRRPIAAMLQTRVTFAVQSDPSQNNTSAKTFSFAPGATLPAPVLRSVSNLRRRLQYAPQGQVQAAGKSVAPNQSLAPSREEHNQRQAHLFADAVERLSDVPKQVLQVSPSMLHCQQRYRRINSVYLTGKNTVVVTMQRLDQIADAAPSLGSSSRVMDVGSGPGTLIPHLQVRYKFAVFVTLANQNSRKSELIRIRTHALPTSLEVPHC